ASGAGGRGAAGKPGAASDRRGRPPSWLWLVVLLIGAGLVAGAVALGGDGRDEEAAPNDAAATTTAPADQTTTTTAPDETTTVPPATETTTTTAPATTTTTAPPTTTTAPPTTTTTAPPTPPPPPPPPAALPSSPAPADAAAPTPGATVAVQPGWNLWAMSELALTSTLGRAPTNGEIWTYWQQVIDANLDQLPDPANPDLLFVGTVLTLPSA
ncbi:MAG: hypothetical protein ACRD0U_16960, partial [Acidimicrobiales bacterium]